MLPLVTEAMQTTAENILRTERFRMTKRGDSCYYWSAEQNPTDYHTVRYSRMRYADDICKHEYRNAMCYILAVEKTLDRDALFTRTAELLSFSELTPELIAVMENGLKFSINSGDIEKAADNIYSLAEKYR